MGFRGFGLCCSFWEMGLLGFGFGFGELIALLPWPNELTEV